ncbi:MAG: ABC transporter permease [Eggerthellaceae bacterium]|nr:ABC transporter permease [Eggerthellaceae bacterium]
MLQRALGRRRGNVEALTSFFDQYGALLAQGTWDTVVMTLAATLFAYVLGVPLGVLLTVTAPNGLKPNRAVNTVLGWIVNMGRSIPFIILLVAIIPFTRFVVGTALGVPGAIVPLVVAAAPFVGRMVEQSLAEVDGGLVEAAQSFGASVMQIVTKVFLKESLPSLIRGASITLITLFGYSAMAGTVGAGGLGDIAIRYGYQRYQDDVMIASIILCIVLVQVIQSVGDILARKIDKRK